MPSRQMAFQMMELEYREHLTRLVGGFENREPGAETSDWIDGMEPDEKKRDRLRAVLMIAVRCHKNGIDPLHVKKIVCWRDADGKPGEVEALVNGARLDGSRRI